MNFADLGAGEAVFVDANTFVYHFSRHPQLEAPCTELLRRIDRGELLGFTSTHMLAEAAHRLMTLEACTLFGWPYPGIAQRLRSHPAEVQKLSLFRHAIEQIPRYCVQMLAVAPHLVAAAAAISQQTGLLTNDGLIVAVMREHGLTNLASHDADFDRVPGLARYGPV
jgi:predicted nucleic acid-binding protein